ncbi:MAG: hypothetical protein ACRDR6_10855 [Pseudonocardiaceae bacterium]
MRAETVIRSPGPMRHGSYMVDHGPVRRAGRVIVHGGAKATRATARHGYRHRVRLAPLYVAAALWVAAFGLHFVQSGWKTAFIPIVLCSVVLVLYARHRTGEGRCIPTRHHAYLWGCWAGGSTWLVVASAAAPWVMPLPGLLAVGAVGVAIPYWWHRRIRPHEVEHIDPEVIEPEIAAWCSKVGSDNGELPGAELVEFARLDNGWESPLLFTNHKTGMEDAFSRVVALSRIYDVPVPNIALRPSPDGRPSRGHIIVLERNPLAIPTLWAGPTMTSEGVCRLGAHADGRQALYRSWRPGSGAVHDLISGCTDSGKSRLVDVLLAEERHCTLIASWVIDPQGGQSLPAWKNATDQFATSPTEGRDLLEYGVEVMHQRNTDLANLHWIDAKGRDRIGVDFFEPSEAMPLVSITVEEAHDVLDDPRAVKAAERLAGMARKCGLKLRLITQLPLLAQLGNSMYLRDQVAAGNVIVLRTAGRLAGQVAFNGALPGADPHMLPRTWPDESTTAGLGYLLGASSHQAMFRTDYLDKDEVYDYATTGPLTRLDESSTPRQHLALVTSSTDQQTPPAAPAHIDMAGTARDKILTYLTNTSTARTNSIAAACGLHKSTVSNTAKELVNNGQLIDLGRGEWATTQTA